MLRKTSRSPDYRAFKPPATPELPDRIAGLKPPGLSKILHRIIKGVKSVAVDDAYDLIRYFRYEDDLARELYLIALPVLLRMWSIASIKTCTDIEVAQVNTIALFPCLKRCMHFLTEHQTHCLDNVIQSVLLEKMRSLESHQLASAGGLQWLRLHNSYSELFGGTESLWEKWWHSTNPGYGYCKLLYLSIATLPENKNLPLVNHANSYYFLVDSETDDAWQEANVSFFEKTFGSEFIESQIKTLRRNFSDFDPVLTTDIEQLESAIKNRKQQIDDSLLLVSKALRHSIDPESLYNP